MGERGAEAAQTQTAPGAGNPRLIKLKRVEERLSALLLPDPQDALGDSSKPAPLPFGLPVLSSPRLLPETWTLAPKPVARNLPLNLFPCH